jgi:hypothetical protein
VAGREAPTRQERITPEIVGRLSPTPSTRPRDVAGLVQARPQVAPRRH